MPDDEVYSPQGPHPRGRCDQCGKPSVCPDHETTGNELSVPAQMAREILIRVARLQLCTNEHRLYDGLAWLFDWPKRTDDNLDVWRDDLLYAVLREVSDYNLQHGEPLLWSLVLADGSGTGVFEPN